MALGPPWPSLGFSFQRQRHLGRRLAQHRALAASQQRLSPDQILTGGSGSWWIKVRGWLLPEGQGPIPFPSLSSQL